MGHTRAKRRRAMREAAMTMNGACFANGTQLDAWGDPMQSTIDKIDAHDDELTRAGRLYDPEIHDEDSVFYRDTYTGPSERELNGGCNRCGSWDDCHCYKPTKQELRDWELTSGPAWDVLFSWDGGEWVNVLHEQTMKKVMPLLRAIRKTSGHDVKVLLYKYIPGGEVREYVLTHSA